MKIELEDQDLLADYRQRLIQDTRFIKMAGIPLPRDHSGRPTNIQVPLDRAYIHVQAILEETSRSESNAKRISVEKKLKMRRFQSII